MKADSSIEHGIKWVYEELVNAATHGLGLALSVVGFAVLLVFAIVRGGAWHITSCAIYGISLVALYTASTLYHSLRAPRAKHVLKVLDHSAIYLLIAGTYTPFALVNLRGVWGWSLFTTVWVLSVCGILFKILFVNRFSIISTIIYVVMGWLGIIAIKPIIAAVPAAGVFWLLAGGVAYTLGVPFFASKRIPYNHAIWHVFVLIGSVCHYFAIFFSVLP